MRRADTAGARSAGGGAFAAVLGAQRQHCSHNTKQQAAKPVDGVPTPSAGAT
jgi:hypothetical protein